MRVPKANQGDRDTREDKASGAQCGRITEGDGGESVVGIPDDAREWCVVLLFLVTCCLSC